MGNVIKRTSRKERFKWIKSTQKFNEDFIKNCSEDSAVDYFLMLILNILKNYINYTMMIIFARQNEN